MNEEDRGSGQGQGADQEGGSRRLPRADPVLTDYGTNSCNEIQLEGPKLCNLRGITFLDYFIHQVDMRHAISVSSGPAVPTEGPLFVYLKMS